MGFEIKGLARNDVNFLDLELISWSPLGPKYPEPRQLQFLHLNYWSALSLHFSVLFSLILINKLHETSTYHRAGSWKRPLEWCNYPEDSDERYMQSKCEKRQGGNVAVGWGKEKKADVAKKKKSSKRRMGLKTQERELWELFLGKNVTELLLDLGRHWERMNSRTYSHCLHLSVLHFHILFFLS